MSRCFLFAELGRLWCQFFCCPEDKWNQEVSFINIYFLKEKTYNSWDICGKKSISPSISRLRMKIFSQVSLKICHWRKFVGFLYRFPAVHPAAGRSRAKSSIHPAGEPGEEAPPRAAPRMLRPSKAKDQPPQSEIIQIVNAAARGGKTLSD